MDGDACPVKDEVYDVAARHELPVVVVANARIWVPEDLGVELVVVPQGPDAADDWIADNVRPGDVVVTGDVPLAARCLAAGAAAIGPDGRPFTEDSIGGALASRDLHAHLREAGVPLRGPRPISPRDRARFSQALDRIVQSALRTS